MVTPFSVFQEYEKIKTYNNKINLYDRVKQNENFYIGRQWEGLYAPDLDKPVLNILQRTINYLIATLITEDVAANFSPQDPSVTIMDGLSIETVGRALSNEVDKVIEQNHIKTLNRDALRDSAVNGDSIIYFYTETDMSLAEETADELGGKAVEWTDVEDNIDKYDVLVVPQTKIKCELLKNVNVLYGNPYSDELQTQPFVLIVQHLHESHVSKMLKKEIKGDEEERVVVITRLWKENGKVKYYRSTKDDVIKKETELGYSLYPLSSMSWYKVKDSYRGEAVITSAIPNQILINKLLAMAARQQQMMSFPKIVYNRAMLKEWSNKVGEAIAVNGDPNIAIATGIKLPEMSNHVMMFIDYLKNNTMDMMGATDAALGKVRPENTSAILAVQRASAAPLELQRISFYQFVEDYIRVMIDIMNVDYGIRECFVDDGVVSIDFSAINLNDLDLRVDIGASSYWSEIMQMQTMDNLFASGIITNPITYLEGIPTHYLKNKQKIIRQMEEAVEQQQAMQEQMLGQAEGQAVRVPSNYRVDKAGDSLGQSAQKAEEYIRRVQNELPTM